MNYWQKGKTLQNGKYTIEKMLGEGGFGVTYLARNTSGHNVAIKTSNRRVQLQLNFKQLQQYFIDEAKRLSQLNHCPHVVNFYELIREDQLWCLVMEYIDGESLASLVTRQGILPESKALDYIQQIGEALKFAHSQQILHRDVKPENILLRRDKSEVVLIDFGISREFTFNVSQSHTQFLTDGFAPIEQYFRKRKRGDYTDVYALAATLYVLLTGYPWQGGKISHHLPNAVDRYDDLRQSKSDPLIEPQKINREISNGVNKAILKGMALEPQDRPQSVKKWLALLKPHNSGNSQFPTIHIPGIKPLSQISKIKALTQLASNRNFQPWLIGSVAFLLILLYVYAPYLPSYRRSSPVPPVEIDYGTLEKLLSSEKFSEADEETFQIMLLLTHRQKKGWLDTKDIRQFPCTDLSKIEQLWIHYSNERFGFSTQKQIWIELGGELGVYDPDVADHFRTTVGWSSNNNLQKNITNQLSVPSGYFPLKVSDRIWKFGAPYLGERLEACKVL
ncbi:MAG: protein kinase [Symploca sp. SIO2D2]|nr:protein kinase [Symploca sp. SIO2D2]